MKTNKIILIIVVVLIILGAVFAYAYYAGKNGPKVFIDNDNQTLTFDKMDAQAALAKIFAAEHNQQVTDTNVTVVNVHNNFASGNISFGPKPGEGGGFLARLVDDVWIVDYEGNGSIDCQQIISLGYLQDVLTGFCDTPVTPVACTMEAKLCPDGSAVGRSGPNCEFAPCPAVNSIITEAQARAIAEASCIKGGEALTGGTYNEGTKTWWFDANLNATKEGCNPACVVNELTKTAEINWRCTGLIAPTE
jgi:hypothetical protein